MPEPGDGDHGVLRRRARNARRHLDHTARARAEGAIAAHLEVIDLFQAVTVGTYLCDDGEPCLEAVASRLRGAGCRLALPVPAPATRDFSMGFQVWNSGDELRAGRYGIPCPPEGPEVVPEVVLVPLVCFDSNLARLGRGAGYYDRWLKAHPTTVPIGVAFEVQRSGSIEAKPHDVAMGAIVTELGIRFARPTGTE